MDSKKCFHTLWTGGLDSTARIVFLSRQDAVVQPYYVIDPTRASVDYELDAMRNITARLRNDSHTKAVIRDLIIINKSEILPDEEIGSSWKRLHDKYGVGSQYDWLARYAKQKNIILEIGIEKGDGRAQTAILTESGMTSFCEEPIKLTNYHIDSTMGHNDVWTVFNRFTFPLWETSKSMEIEMLKNLHCDDIIDMTWFCHSPLRGKPCGHCNPCKDAFHYNLGWRITKSNYYLWYLARPKEVAKSIVRKLIK